MFWQLVLELGMTIFSADCRLEKQELFITAIKCVSELGDILVRDGRPVYRKQPSGISFQGVGRQGWPSFLLPPLPLLACLPHRMDL